MRKKRLLAILAIGERSRGELASELGISSQSWLSKAYLSPLMVQGYIAHSFFGARPHDTPNFIGLRGV
jgi:predicted ArsR family transcriptional regulator